MAAKAKAEAAALQAIQDYLKSEEFINAIDSAVERAVDKQLTKILERLSVTEEDNKLIKDQLDQNDGKLLELETKLASKDDEIARMKDTVSHHESSIQNLQMALNEAEQYSRRNCLKFYGVKEVPKGTMENTDDTICQIVNSRLEVTLHPNDIDRSHRVAAPKRDEAKAGKNASHSTNQAIRPRAIIVKLSTYRKRNEIIKARRKLKGTKIAIDESLTKTNQELLWLAKKHEKVLEAWSTDGRIIVLLQATRGKTMTKVIHSRDELNNI